MPRLTDDKWAAMRIEWEGEPLATFSALADKYGVNVGNVSRKAAKEGWSKRGNFKRPILARTTVNGRDLKLTYANEKRFQEDLFFHINVVVRIYDLPPIKKAFKEYRIRTLIADIVIFHTDGSATVIECKPAGASLTTYLQGAAQSKCAAHFLQIAEDGRLFGRVRCFLATPTGVDPEVGEGCIALDVGYMPYGEYGEYFKCQD